MSILQNHPIGYHPAVCAGCNAALFTAASGIILCQRCERSQAVADIGRLATDVQQLREGTGIFAGMPVSERSEQMVALGLPAINAAPRFPGFATMDSDKLIAIVAGDACFMPGEQSDAVAEALVELCKRLGPPTRSERDDIESICIQLEAADSDKHYA